MANKPSYRNAASYFVDIGRELATIENAINDVQATMSVNDGVARGSIGVAWRASRRLTKHLGMLNHIAEEEGGLV